MSEDVEYRDNGQFVMMDFHELNNHPDLPDDDIGFDYVQEVIRNRESYPPQPIEGLEDVYDYL